MGTQSTPATAAAAAELRLDPGPKGKRLFLLGVLRARHLPNSVLILVTAKLPSHSVSTAAATAIAQDSFFHFSSSASASFPRSSATISEQQQQPWLLHQSPVIPCGFPQLRLDPSEFREAATATDCLDRLFADATATTAAVRDVHVSADAEHVNVGEDRSATTTDERAIRSVLQRAKTVTILHMNFRLFIL